MTGLGLRVSDTGRKTWIVVHRVKGGKLVKHTIGTYPTPYSLAEARDEARKVRDVLEKGKTPKEAKADEAAARGPLFEEVAEDYIALHVRVNRKTEKDRREVESRIRRELVRRWKGQPACEIRNRDVVRMIREIIGDGDSKQRGQRRGGPNAARHVLSDARALFNWAVEQDLYGITGNPVVIRARTAHGPAPHRNRALEDWELRAVWQASFRATPHPYGPIIRMLILTGQRLNEVARARWSEVDLDGALLTVSAERMKVDEGAHTVPLTPLAVELLRELPRFAGDAHVFSTTRGDKPLSSFSKPKARFNRLASEAAGRTVPHWTQHDLRRTVRTGLSRVGVRREVAEEVLAHKKQGMIKVYDIHAFDDEKRDALMKWEARLREIVGSAPPGANHALPAVDVAE